MKRYYRPYQKRRSILADLAARRRPHLTDDERARRVVRLFTAGCLVIAAGRVTGDPHYQPVTNALNRLIDSGHLTI